MNEQFWMKFLALPEIQRALGWSGNEIIVENNREHITTSVFAEDGLLSTIFEIKDGRTQKTVLCKISTLPSRSAVLQLPDEVVRTAFDREFLFYREIYPALMKTSSASCLPAVHFVGEIDDFQCLVMSNLKNSGFQSLDWREGLSVPLLKLTISKVAKLQLHMTEIEAQMPHLDLSYPVGQFESVKAIAARWREGFLQDLANHPLFREDTTFDIRKFERFIAQDEKMHLSGQHPLERVMKHGDIWTANLLYHPHSPGGNDFVDCAMVDWQFVNDSSGPLHDLTNLLLLACEENALESAETLQELFDCFQDEWKNTPYEFTAETFQHYLIDSFVFAFYWLTASWEAPRGRDSKPRILNSVYYLYKHILRNII